MSKLKVLLTDYAWPDLDIERRILAGADAELIVAEKADSESLARLAVEADAIMTNWARVDEHVLKSAARCRIVARLGIGLDNIDVAFATRRGMIVTNVPDYCLVEVAEHALALLLALARKVGYYNSQAKANVYQLQSGPALRRIEGQTLGIVGFGRIGRKLADKAAPLGLRILAMSRTQKDLPHGVERCALDDLLALSDYVSLHAPLTDSTRRLIGKAQLARMKPTAYLINTARGGLVDMAALVDALANDRLAGAALDVQDPEPPDLTKPPYNDPRVIVTPHAAFVSLESLENLRTRASQQVADALSDRRPENVVNDSASQPAGRPK
jgi:D-3-phosphoglycerate dehydrogenase / 2-oxoglutarate reductase